MQPDFSSPVVDIACVSCQAFLPEYVRRELDNEPVEQLFPAVTFHIETCYACETAYYREFRQQGVNKPVSELQQVGQREWAAPALEKILASATSPVGPSHPTRWYASVTDFGRVWRDRATDLWQQVEISLAGLVASLSPGRTPVLALQGIQGDSSQLAAEGSQTFAVLGDQCEMRITATPVLDVDKETLYNVDVAISLFKRFGDFSGVAVTLEHQVGNRRGQTDALGRVHFTGVDPAHLAEMQVVVDLSNETPA